MITDSISPETGSQLTDCDEVIEHLPLDRLDANPSNPRRAIRTSGPDWDLFVQSIRESGIIEPLIVRPAPTSGEVRYEIVAGHRRHRGAEAAGRTTVPCIVRVLSDQDVMVAALIENLQRVDLDPVEEASGYFRLVECGMTQADMATKVGRSAKHVGQRLQLLNVPAKVLAGLKKGVFTIEDALEYSKVDDTAIVEQAIRNIDEGQWPERALASARRTVVEDRALDEMVRGLNERKFRTVVTPYIGTTFYKDNGLTPLEDLGMKNSAKGHETKDWLVAVVRRDMPKKVTWCTDDRRTARQYAPKVAEDGTAKAEAEKKRAAAREVRDAKATEDAALLIAVRAKVSMTDLVNEAGDLVMSLISEATAKNVCKLLDLEVGKVQGFYDWKGAVREQVSAKSLIHIVHGLRIQHNVQIGVTGAKKDLAEFLKVADG